MVDERVGRGRRVLRRTAGGPATGVVSGGVAAVGSGAAGSFGVTFLATVFFLTGLQTFFVRTCPCERTFFVVHRFFFLGLRRRRAASVPTIPMRLSEAIGGFTQIMR